MQAIAWMPGMASMASPTLLVARNFAEFKAQGPKWVLLVAAVRSAADQLAWMLTSEVSTSAIGTPNTFCASLSSIIDARPQLGMYQLSKSIRNSFHQGARDNDTTWYFNRKDSELVATELVAAWLDAVNAA